MKRICLLALLAVVACGQAIPINRVQEACKNDNPRVGQTAILSTKFHGVSGTAKIVDNCTIEISQFSYDGGGLDVRVYGSKDGNFKTGVNLSPQDIHGKSYANQTLTLKLPADPVVSLDEVKFISIYCVSVNESFGDGEFK